MHYEELAQSFPCAGDELQGVLTLPVPMPARAHGVVIIVGGPQYRAGSHRQFTLLARTLAARGIPVLRFDYRGMGDSAGERRGFDQVDDDVGAAVGQLLAAVPQVRDVVLWGLCDGACAALSYAAVDRRVHGLVLLNPWAHTASGAARATLGHYYRRRLLDAQFWRKLLGGGIGLAASWQSWRALRDQARSDHYPPAAGDADAPAGPDMAALPDRMLRHWSGFGGAILLVLSGNDLVAREFTDLAAQSPAWRRQMALQRVTRRDLAAADHTFSRAAWRDQVAAWTGDWVLQC
jgi:exosortase A-associated hydrolase 1